MNESRHLLLLRHAKSSWDDPSLADHDRPLAPRGRKAATLIRAHLRRSGIEMSLILCSSARRTVQTLELVAPGGEVAIEDELYGASADGLLTRLREVPDHDSAVMLIGHNPAMQDLAAGLAAGAGLGEQKFPTAALATLAFTGLWRELDWGSADLIEFVRPRDLTRCEP
jgi:phosphohistidine phosphatase